MFTRLEELEFLVEPEIHQYCGPLYFGTSLETCVGTVTNNGTYGLVDMGTKKLLVTCEHVWANLRSAQSKNPDARMVVCLTPGPGFVFDSRYLIDHDGKLDLATFDLAPLLNHCVGRKFYSLNQNPAPKVEKGDSLAFIGYPGNFREGLGNGLHFGSILHVVTASDVSGLSVVADFSQLKAIFKRSPARTGDANSNGGISGSPCFLLRRNQPAKLVAFTHSESMRMLHFTHVSCINPDGSIDRQAARTI